MKAEERSMHDENRKTGHPEAGPDTYETAVLNFLDKEIGVSLSPVHDSGSRTDDVDVLVNSLLEQAIAAAEGNTIPAAAVSEDLKRSSEALPAGVGKILVPGSEPRVELPTIPAAVMPVSAPIFAAVASKPGWRGRMLMVSGAALFLLAGVGIVYVTGSKNSPPGKSAGPVSGILPSPAAGPQILTTPAPESGKGGTVSPSQAARIPVPANSRPPTERASVLRDSAVVAPGTDAGTALTRAQNKPSPAGEVVPPAAGEEKTALGATASSESSASSQLPPPVVITPAPSVTQAPVAPAATLAQLVPNNATNLEELSAAGRPAFKTPPTPRSAIPATVVSRALPLYPEIARRSGVDGTVVVDAQIDAQGRVVKATAESGPAVLRPEAVRAVLQWRFKPATLDGISVPSATKVSIVFIKPNS
jgi:periplasmic protein TonB